MPKILLTLTAFLVIVAAAFALKCYTCIGTEETCSKNTLKSDPDMLVECPSQSDRCMRIAASRDGNNSVSNTCANQQSCNLTQTVCDRLESDLDYCKVDCCTTDGCNAGPDPHSLKCYSCVEFGKESEEDTVCSKSKLDANEAKYVTTCLGDLDTCQRSHGTAKDIHAVSMSCTTASLCEDAKKKCDDSGDNCGVACCTTDKCNAGSSVSFNVFLMAVSSLLGLALLK